MTFIVQSKTTSGLGDPKMVEERTKALQDKDFNYIYPLKGGAKSTRLDLKPGSDFHDDLVKEILFRASQSHEIMQRKFDVWNKISEQLEAYIPKDEEEREIEDEDRRKPTSTVVPAMWTYLDTLLTHTMSSLDPPIFKYLPGGPEDLEGVIKLEAVVAHQAARTKMGLNFHTWWRDAYCYGLGVLANGWEKKTHTVTVRKQVPVTEELSGVEVGSDSLSTFKNQTLYEGNFLVNISPFVFLPDPAVPIHEVQRGEYVGYLALDNLMGILSREFNPNKSAEAVWFNGKYMKGLPGRSTFYVDSASPVADSRYDIQDRASHPVDIIHMYITLIPKDWKLGNSEKPEKWVFSVANDSVILRAQPLNLDHDMYPIAVCAPDFDGYKVTPTSRMEAIYGLQIFTDWLLNSRIRDQRKNVHGRLVVDPARIMIGSLEDPDQGIIYTRPNTWGGSVKDAVVPLPVSDVTQINIADMANVMQIMREATGAQEQMQGSQRKGGERVTAREVGITSSSALGRIARAVEVGQLQGMHDLAFMLAANTRQLLSEDTYVSIVGRMEDDLSEELRKEVRKNGNRVKVSPLDLNIAYDVNIGIGSSNQQDMSPEQMIQVLQNITNQPEIATRIDIYRLFRYLMGQMGFRNMPDFERSPEEVAAMQAQQAAPAQPTLTGG